MQPTRLLLAVFAGLGFATIVAALVTVHPGRQKTVFSFSPSGMELALPLAAFWAVAGLCTALRVPLALSGSWAFRVIHGRPKPVHLQSAETWTAVCASFVTCSIVAALHLLEPAASQVSHTTLAVQLSLALALPVLLTDIFFLKEHAIPFTEVKPYSVNGLTYLVLTYFCGLPLYAFSIAALEPWLEEKPVHLPPAVVVFVGLHFALRFVRKRYFNQNILRMDIVEDEILLPGELGLRT